MVLSVLTGAPGSGKTASLAAVRERLAGVVVVDMDAFLDAGSAPAGADLRSAARHWPAYTRLCRQLVATVLDSGVDCLLLTPLEPHAPPPRPPDHPVHRHDRRHGRTDHGLGQLTGAPGRPRPGRGRR